MLSEDDAIALNRSRANNDLFLKKRITRARISLTISLAIVGVGFWIILDSLFILIWFLTFAILIFFFYKKYYGWRIKLRIRETYKQPQYASTLTSNTLEASEVGLIQTSKLAQTKIEWGQVDDFFETPEYYFNSVGKVLSIAVPKSTERIIDGETNEFISVCRELKRHAA